MIRDLKYPEDARQVIDALHQSLQYDAAVAVLGKACSDIPLPDHGGPDFSVFFRISGREADAAVRRDASGLFSRFALSSMISRIDHYGRQLLLQRRVLEQFLAMGRKFAPGEIWPILRRVQTESRGGPVKMCSELIVENPSPDLTGRMRWLEGLVSVRNCLTHRMGFVEIEDVKKPGTRIEDVRDSDKLKAVWLRTKLLVDGVEIEGPHLHKGPNDGQAQAVFEEYEREWAIGETINVTPEDCQAFGMSLGLLGNALLAEFEHEMNDLIASRQHPNAAPPVA